MGQANAKLPYQEFNGEQNRVPALMSFQSTRGSGGTNINEIAVRVCNYDLGKCSEGKTHARLLRK